jgi:hypothetical protein
MARVPNKGCMSRVGCEGADAGGDPRDSDCARLRTGGAARRARSHSITHLRLSLTTLKFYRIAVKGNVFEVRYLVQSYPLRSRAQYIEKRSSSTSRRCELLFKPEALLLWPQPDRASPS